MEMDSIEEMLGKSVEDLTDTELVVYVKTSMKEINGLDLPVQGMRERSLANLWAGCREDREVGLPASPGSPGRQTDHLLNFLQKHEVVDRHSLPGASRSGSASSGQCRSSTRLF